MRYKLIISDFDGTLRNSEGIISEGNAAAIRNFAALGGVFAICTGRMVSSILPYAKSLNLCGLIVAYQGGVIVDIESGNYVRDVRLPMPSAVKICEFLEERNYHIHVYDGDTFYVNKDDDFRMYYENICRVKGILTKNISETVRAKGIAPHKILVMCDLNDRERIYREAQAQFGKEFYVTTSSENLIEFGTLGCDKGSAVEYLAAHYGISLDETIAIGDNYNDIPMLKTAGLGVAVENAEKAVKESADLLTRSCDEDGVGYIIRRYGLGENK